MSVCTFNVKIKSKKLLGTVCSFLFILLSVMVYDMNVRQASVSFVLGLVACVAVVLLVAGNENKFGKGMDFIAKYTMPIFLMHTLFAATFRIVLIKFGITNAVVHVALGLLISFLGPIVAAWVMKKTKWLEFFLYPGKFMS